MIATIAMTLAAAAAQDAPATQESPSPAPAGYQLVWQEEFDGSGLPDSSRWRYDTWGNKDGWANEELQYYAVANPDYARVENGVLTITARRESLAGQVDDHGGQRFTSARLLSEQEWRYGFFEVRAKLPCQRGSWPAIWMLPTDPQADWPLMGEIDIMEHVGFDPGVVHGTVHTGAYNHVQETQKGAKVTIPDACGAFHNYQLHWTPERIEIGVDGIFYFQFDNDGAGDPATWPFDQKFHFILNTAVGGMWGGREGVDEGSFPWSFEVDHLRVWQRAGN